ncbi:Endo-1,4-beta-xylanase 5 [Orbilia javanica]|uniref:Endo-1,4-beta-xylanase 5 n=1 Tax=Orbilia javanica TaxID=47235 RepID=A0AAN8MKC2_9PEZI
MAAASTTGILKVKGTDIVDKDGKTVLLRGAGIGGWMNMENFISGYPGREYQIRAALTKVLGQEKSDFFFDKFLEYFFTESDAKFYKDLGLNCIRVPFNYRHFEDDMNPRVLKPEGFKHLDRLINICAEHGIYTILDLHTAPGGQNGDWHADIGHHVPEFWTHKDFQDRGIWLWEQLAAHYKSNPWIAGYNVLNEPTDPTHFRLQLWYDRVYNAIRAIDPDHILFLDGNTFGSDFSHFVPEETCQKWENVVYSVHDYSRFGFPASKEWYTGSEEQKKQVRKNYNKKVEWMLKNNLPIWNGEWGPVYARPWFDGDDSDRINESRLKLLDDQLTVYDEERIPWSIWTYKDIGFQGMVYVSQDTPYMKLLQPILEKKQTMAVDSWGTNEVHIAHIVEPIREHLTKNIAPEYRNLYPYPVIPYDSRVSKIAINILTAEFLVQEWADYFKDKSFEELDELAASFKFENCLQRESLNKALVAHKDVSR